MMPAGFTSSALSVTSDKSTIKHVLDELTLKENCTSDELLPLIKYVIPIYGSIGTKLQGMLRVLCAHNFMLIPQVLEYIKELNESTERKLYYKFLVDVMEKENYCLKTLMDKSTRQQETFLKAIFFGSRLFNSLSEHITIIDYLKLLQNQWKFSFQNTENFKKIHVDSFIATLKLHDSLGAEMLIGELLLQDIEMWKSFNSMLKVGTAIQQRKIFISYLAPFLCAVAREENCSEIYTLLQNLSFELPIHSRCFEWNNIWFKILYVRNLSTSKRKTLLSDILPYFEQIDSYYDQEIAEMLFLLLKNLTKEDKFVISQDPVSLAFVTKRLSSEIKLVRERTMLLAKEITCGELEYSSDFAIEIPELTIVETDLILPLTTLETEPIDVSRDSHNKEIIPSLQKLSLLDSDDESEDENSYDILFVKDLLLEFERCQKTDLSVLQLLKKTVQLIRQKRDFPTEVGFYSKALLAEVSTLSNNFDEENFEQWVVNAIVSVIVVCPDRIIDLYKILFNNELSLQQRMLLLTSSALAARELRGFEDDMILAPKYNFVTQKLPWDSQQKSEENISLALTEMDNLEPEKIVWKSRKLTSIKDPKPQDNFRKHSSNFFYPLIHGWFNGIDMGSFDKIFKKHYITTLRTILDCSSATYKYTEMQNLMQQVELDAFNQKIPLD